MEISKFILLTTHRSGTNLLLTSLGGNSPIKCHKRVFVLRVIFERFAFDRPGSPFYQYRTASLQRRFDYMFRPKQLINNFMTELYIPTNGVQAIGLRLIYDQADKYPQVLEWAVANKVSIIHLIRENSLKAIVYEKIPPSHSTSKTESMIIQLHPLKLKMELVKLLNQIEKYRGLLKDTRYLEVTYESLVANREPEIYRILDFLQVNRFAPSITIPGEPNPNSLEDIIENYDQVKQTLSHTALEKYLD